MSYEKTPFSPKDNKTQIHLDGLLSGVDLQMCLMEAIRNQLESYVNTGKTGLEGSDNSQVNFVPACAEKSFYNSESYMADYVLDDCGKVTDIRYDWVKGV